MCNPMYTGMVTIVNMVFTFSRFSCLLLLLNDGCVNQYNMVLYFRNGILQMGHLGETSDHSFMHAV